MATLSHSESRRLYSWWWDSHIPKNSKWLQENLTDMDSKVKQMIKLIEEDADSFARRAEMYYKKRPELMKLVEEFYRAYRALAERYDHATVELRQAHRTMAKAFPNQVPYDLDDDSGPESEPHTPEGPHPYLGFHDSVELHKDAGGFSPMNLHAVMKPNSGNGKVNEKKLIFQNAGKVSSENQKVNASVQSESVHHGTAEVQILKDTLAKIQAEKEAVLSQYTETLQKLSNLEKELCRSRNNAGGLDEQATKAQIEIKALKAALKNLEAERDAALHKYNQCMERVTSLEATLSEAQMDAKGLNERATKAEMEAEALKEELSRLRTEKEAVHREYKQCLGKISALENKITGAEENASTLKGQIEISESEVMALKQAVTRLTEEKEAAAHLYKQCMETIVKLEAEISSAQEENKQLKNEIQTGEAKLKMAEDQFNSLERSNQSLQEEADRLVHKIETKDQELSKKQDELEKLQALLQDERLRFVQIEATLHNLQQLHSQSQEDQRALALELKNVLQVLKDLEMCKHNLEEEIRRVKDESQSLNEKNLSAAISLDNLQKEISSLKALKEKLEQELAVQTEHTNALEQEISNLKEEIEGLKMRYQALILQVESVGLSPECLASSVKELQHEKLQLKEMCEKEIKEKEVLSEQLKDMEKVLEKNTIMESSLSELSGVLQGSREKIKELQNSYQSLQGEKTSLVAEKSTLLSQLQIMTESMQKLLEKNTMLENSLSGVNIELEGLRVKSKSLDEYCQLLNKEKSSLLTERSILVLQLENVEQRLGNLERRFTKLEERYDGLENEKKSTLCKVEELRGTLTVEKEEHASYVKSTEARMTGLESIIQLLQEENVSRKRDVDEELDKAVNAQVEIFILQRFIRDLEEKNLSLLFECQRHVESSKLSDKLISELEAENLEQQVEGEFLLGEIEKLRMGIHQVFTLLQIGPVAILEDKFLHDELPLPYILAGIEELKSSLRRNEDEKHQLLVENSVLSTALEQLRSDSSDLKSGKRVIEKELQIVTEQREVLQKDKHHLMDVNRQLRCDVSRGEQQEAALKNEIENLHMKLVDLQQSYLVLQEENCKALEENRSLLKKISNVNEEKSALQEEITAVVQEAISLSNLSMVLEIFGTEKAAELRVLAEDLDNLQKTNRTLSNDLEELEELLEMKDIENLKLNESVERFEKNLSEITDVNGQLNIQVAVTEDLLKEKERELSEAKQELIATQNLNFELSRDVEEFERQYEESKSIKEELEKRNSEMREDNNIKANEINRLHEQNENLESELGRLQEEIEQHILREESLCLELQEKSSDFELWDSEATSFYFDLQVSSVREALLDNKLNELNGAYENLKDESSCKSAEIEQMKGRISSLESEIGGLRAQMSAYDSIIDSLRDDVASLENSALNSSKLQEADNQYRQDGESTVQGSTLLLQEDKSSVPDKVSGLLKIQTRVRAVSKAMTDEMQMLPKLNRGDTDLMPKSSGRRSRELELRGSVHQDVKKEERRGEHGVSDNIMSQEAKPEIFEVRNGIQMKDIPLDQVSDVPFRGTSRRHGRVDDQMLQLWETTEQDLIIDNPHNRASMQTGGNVPCRAKDSRDRSKTPSLEVQVEKELSVDKIELSSSIRSPNQEGSKRKILERLASDAQKLTSLQTAVKELRKRMDMLKRSKKTKDVEYETVKTQLQEVEMSVAHLANINDELGKNLGGSPSSWDGNTSADLQESGNARRRRVLEQARKESEKIGRLQFDIQNIQYVLLKLEDDKKSKGKSKFSESRTGILLKDFIYSGNRNSRRKKVRFCGCMRTSSNRHSGNLSPRF